MNTRFSLWLLMVSAALALGGCSAFGLSEDENVDEKKIAESPAKSPAALYNEARDLMDAEKFKDSIPAFEEVERQHPYSELAVKGQVMAGYAAYRAADYTQATSILERFTKVHPGDSNLPYAYYLIALCYYEQITDVGRDQKMTEQALQGLTEVVRRFPETDYARDAKLKLDLTYDHLAGKEMQVGRYYLKRDEPLAAINRFRFVVENYQTTTHVPEALHRLVEAYLMMGIQSEATKYAAVLGTNFPASVWYKMSYQLLNPTTKAASDNEGWFGL
jgi:outer membrane protein assembly factor BamD